MTEAHWVCVTHDQRRGTSFQDGVLGPGGAASAFSLRADGTASGKIRTQTTSLPLALQEASRPRNVSQPLSHRWVGLGTPPKTSRMTEATGAASRVTRHRPPRRICSNGRRFRDSSRLDGSASAEKIRQARTNLRLAPQIGSVPAQWLAAFTSFRRSGGDNVPSCVPQQGGMRHGRRTLES